MQLTTGMGIRSTAVIRTVCGVSIPIGSPGIITRDFRTHCYVEFQTYGLATKVHKSSLELGKVAGLYEEHEKITTPLITAIYKAFGNKV